MDADVLRQLGRLVDQLETKDAPMIDPVEFGEIKGAVAALQTQVADFKTRQALMDQKLDIVLDKLAEAKGGWRTLMLLGGAASTVGGCVTWIATHWQGAP